MEVEAGEELHGPENSKRVFGKGLWGNHSELFLGKVFQSADAIDYLPLPRIVKEGVDGEVSASGGFAAGHFGAAVNGETAMAGACFGIFARQGKVYCVASRHR